VVKDGMWYNHPLNQNIMKKTGKRFRLDDLFDFPYFKCILHEHPELLKTGPQSKFFKRVKGRTDTFGMAKGPVFECLECGCRYIYSVLKPAKSEKEGVMYTPVGQFVRPKWMEKMPEGEPICGGGADQWSLVWKKGEDPHWDITATMYISWVGGKMKKPGDSV